MNQNLTINTINTSSEPIRILKTIQKFGFKSAVIAGGAIRDLYSGKDIKDIDIFLVDPTYSVGKEKITTKTRYSQTSLDEKFIIEIMGIKDSELNDPYTSVWIEQTGFADGDGDDSDIAESYFKQEHLTQVWNITYGSHQYQLIFIKKDPVEYVLNHFDFGICRTYCDGVKMRFATDFLTDMRNETITICDIGYKSGHFAYVLKNHLQRVRMKFPTHKVVVAPSIMKLVNERNKKYLSGPIIRY